MSTISIVCLNVASLPTTDWIHLPAEPAAAEVCDEERISSIAAPEEAEAYWTRGQGSGPLSSSGQPQLLLSSVLLSWPEPQWLNRPLTPFNESSGVLSANTPRPACIVSAESGFTGSQRCSSLDSRASPQKYPEAERVGQKKQQPVSPAWSDQPSLQTPPTSPLFMVGNVLT